MTVIKSVRTAVLASTLAAGVLVIAGPAGAGEGAQVTAPVKARAQLPQARQNGALWLFADSQWSGQLQAVLDPGSTACVNLASPYYSESQISESTYSIQVYGAAACAGTPVHVFEPNEDNAYLPMMVASARFLH